MLQFFFWNYVSLANIFCCEGQGQKRQKNIIFGTFSKQINYSNQVNDYCRKTREQFVKTKISVKCLPNTKLCVSVKLFVSRIPHVCVIALPLIALLSWRNQISLFVCDENRNWISVSKYIIFWTKCIHLFGIRRRILFHFKKFNMHIIFVYTHSWTPSVHIQVVFLWLVVVDYCHIHISYWLVSEYSRIFLLVSFVLVI